MAANGWTVDSNDGWRLTSDPIQELGPELSGAIITSGRRTPEGNSSLPGSVPNSGHLRGDKMDIVPGTSGLTMTEISDIAKKHGYKPLIESDHVDIGGFGGGVPYIGQRGSQGKGPDMIQLGWTLNPGTSQQETADAMSSLSAPQRPASPSDFKKSGGLSPEEWQAHVSSIPGYTDQAETIPLTADQEASAKGYDSRGQNTPLGLAAFRQMYTGAPEFGPWLKEHLGGGKAGEFADNAANYYAHVIQLFPALANAGVADVVDVLGSVFGASRGQKERAAGNVNDVLNVGLLGAGIETPAALSPETTSRISQMAKEGYTAKEIKDATGADVTPKSVAAYNEYQKGGGKEAPSVEQLGRSETLDMGEKGVQDVTTFTTDELQKKLEQEDAQKVTPQVPKDEETDQLKSQAEQVWMKALSDYQREHGVDESKPIDLNGPDIKAADKAVQDFWVENDRRSVDRPKEKPLDQKYESNVAPELQAALDERGRHRRGTIQYKRADTAVQALANRLDMKTQFPDAPDGFITEAMSIKDQWMTRPWHDKIDQLANKYDYHPKSQDLSGGQPVFDEYGNPTTEFEAALRGGSIPPTEPPNEPPSGGPPSGEPPSQGGGETPQGSVVERLTAAIKAARPVRKVQEKLYSTERSRRLKGVQQAQATTSGEEGFHAELSALKGEMPKADFESVRDQFSHEDITQLFDMVKNHPALTLYDKINARTGLAKILGEHAGGVPTSRELNLLSRVFGHDFVRTVMKNRPLVSKLLEGVSDIGNLPRALVSTIDMSAPLRQGVFLIGRKEFYPAFGKMLKMFFSDKTYRASQEEIRSRPTYPMMQEAGLELTDVSSGHNGGPPLSDKEEQFMSNLAERIPVVGIGVRASDRAYSGFLNKLRADVFDDLAGKMAQLGISFETSPKALKDLARFINSATGRGDLGKRLNNAAPLLNSLFFSPKLQASRVNLMNPLYYAKLHPFVRKEAIKSLLSFGAIATTVLMMAKMNGAEVETNPRSSDFLKIKNGDMRHDILGGFQQYGHFAAQMWTHQTKSSNTGDVRDLNDTNYRGPGPRNRLDVAQNFLVSKLNPLASLVTDYWRGSDPVGNKFTWSKAILSRSVSLFLQDTYDASKEYGANGALAALPGAFGVSVQTYQNKSPSLFGAASRNDPTVQALQEMKTDKGNPLIRRPNKTVYDYNTDKDVTFSDADYKHYVEVSGDIIVNQVRDEMSKPEWKTLSDADKKQLVKDIVHDAHEDTREQMLEKQGWTLNPSH